MRPQRCAWILTGAALTLVTAVFAGCEGEVNQGGDEDGDELEGLIACAQVVCGDGAVCGNEACDDGGESATCDEDCTAAACGDGVINNSANETCDDGGESATCNEDCTAAACGDGVINSSAGEACDDGGVADGDGCSALCVQEPHGGWVRIPGGTFLRASQQVAVPSFEIMATEVTVADYDACVSARGCAAPDTGGACNWNEATRQSHPINCIQWQQAVAYCTWIGGRLPTEAEWEYAARSGGHDVTYAWGNDAPTCEYAVMTASGGGAENSGCGTGMSWEVCSKPAGNTIQGLCDVAGNVSEWVQDWYHDGYDGAPTDGSAWEEGGGLYRVHRGGGWLDSQQEALSVAHRAAREPPQGSFTLGVRCARGGLTTGACGDGVWNSGEACDDGNTIDGDGCDSNCTRTACGNGIKTAGEFCDDAGESATCDADCTAVKCGDGLTNTAAAEICDDGNADDCYGNCSADCSKAVTGCGDGFVCGSESCDDGEESATCDADCTAVRCGDGVLNATAGEMTSCLADRWVSIPEGSFMMGSAHRTNEQPVHEVTVPSFVMMATEVTVADYRACVTAGACTAPNESTSQFVCNWTSTGRDDHPVNCATWHQATTYCAWIGARLPTEAEWEYAARSGGQNITYPWGDEPASCTHAVIWDELDRGCGRHSTWPVCSKLAGRSVQGLCDMAGNAFEWVQDVSHDSYQNAPGDGSAWEVGGGQARVYRGGGWNFGPDFCRATYRGALAPGSIYGFLGFRCAAACRPGKKCTR